jgi:hypothetical protein
MWRTPFLPFLYTTSHSILYVILYVKHTILYAKCTISYEMSVKITILYVPDPILAILVYDVAYDIVCFIVNFAEIVYNIQKLHQYYTILHAYIVCTIGIIRYCTPISIKTYDNTVHCGVQCRIRFSLLVPGRGAAFAAGRTGHAPGAPTGPAS